jgi:hypothetical protein
MNDEQAQQHFLKYRDNVDLADRMEVHLPADAGWTCVVRFYAALHLITAYLLEKKNVRFDPSASAHPDRKRAMERCPELREAPRRYRQLKDLSESVRYDPGFKFTQEHKESSKNSLRRIVAIVEPKIDHG